MAKIIRLIPVNTVDARLADRLAVCIEERFLTGVRIERSLALPRTALNATRNQLFAPTLYARIAKGFPGQEGLALAVTEYDCYKTSQRYLFADADANAGTGVVALFRLRPEFYGEEPDPNLLFQRVLKESVYALGRAMGLRSCHSPRCAMHATTSVFETDLKSPNLCEACLGRISRARQ